MDELMSALGYLGDLADKPGRAVRGLLAGRGREAMAALPFSDTAGLTDPAERVSGSDLLASAGLQTGNELADALLGFGAEATLDPTSYLGVGLGARLGATAGRSLERAAVARGPGYTGGAAHLAAMSEGGAKGFADDLARLAPAALSEVPPASALIGKGTEGVAFRTPTGDVVRLGYVNPGEAGRPVADSVLQATRAVDYPVPAGSAVGVRAERVPFADMAGDRKYWLGGSGVPGQTRIGAVRKAAADEGLLFADAHAGNVGVYGGRPVVIDPGAVEPLAGAALTRQPVTAAADPSPAAALLLDLLGGQPAMRRALDAGRAAPAYERSLAAAGGAAGGVAGSSPTRGRP